MKHSFQAGLTAILAFVFSFTSLHAQQITYADVLKDDRKDMQFEILGNVNGNYLIYKNSQNRNYLTVYNPDMTLKENVRMNLPDLRLLNIDFVQYPSKVLVVYQYQHGNIVYCNAAFYNIHSS